MIRIILEKARKTPPKEEENTIDFHALFHILPPLLVLPGGARSLTPKPFFSMKKVYLELPYWKHRFLSIVFYTGRKRVVKRKR